MVGNGDITGANQQSIAGSQDGGRISRQATSEGEGKSMSEGEGKSMSEGEGKCTFGSIPDDVVAALREALE